MFNVLVIADDLTGAAEIAGVGLRYGLPTRLVRDQIVEVGRGVTVVDTDSRLQPASDASETLRRFVREAPASHFELIFKKVDSALRGPILPEIEAVMAAYDRPAALLVPENPSRGRTIRAGEYRIHGALLQTTEFADDPDYPARTGNVLELLGAATHDRIVCLDPGQEPMASGITIGAASNAHDMRHWAARTHRHLLPAGGADFFQATLEQHGLVPTRTFSKYLPSGNTLWVCGSVSVYNPDLAKRAEKEGVVICPMPDRLFRSAQASQMNLWATAICDALKSKTRAMMLIPQKLDRTPGVGQRLQATLAQVVSLVLAKARVTNLLMEGGATASAICRKLNWTDFEIRSELIAGVVQMRSANAPEPMIVVKPGSYAWPDSVWAYERHPAAG